jgi:hypothetical protein
VRNRGENKFMSNIKEKTQKEKDLDVQQEKDRKY